MARNKTRVNIDWTRLTARLGGMTKRGQMALDIQVLKDTTPFVPRDTGNLAQSGVRASTPGSGQVIWDAPYADAQYYGRARKAHDVHPLAVMRWFEAAKAAYRETWLRVAKAAARL